MPDGQNQGPDDAAAALWPERGLNRQRMLTRIDAALAARSRHDKEEVARHLASARNR